MRRVLQLFHGTGCLRAAFTVLGQLSQNVLGHKESRMASSQIEMTAPSTAPVVITESMQRLLQVRDLWTRNQKDQLEIGRLLYEERKERLGVGGRGIHEGFAQWLREAGIPNKSAYRRIAEYEISIGERAEPEDKPVSPDTSLPPADAWKLEPSNAYLLRGVVTHRAKIYPDGTLHTACGGQRLPRAGNEPTCFYCTRRLDEIKRTEFEDAHPLPDPLPEFATGQIIYQDLYDEAQKAKADAIRMEEAAAPAVEDDAELDALFAPPTAEELAQEFPVSVEAPAMEIPEPKESDLARLRQLFNGTGVEVKKSNHGSKYVLDGLSFAQCREIATVLG
jgi:hypothetical protein